MKLSAWCNDCNTYSLHHITTWIEGLMENSITHSLSFLTSTLLPDALLDQFLQTLFTKTKLLHYRSNVQEHEILPRSWCFIQEAQKKGIICEVLFNIAGATNHLRATLPSGKQIYFESLPHAPHIHTRYSKFIDDKAAARTILAQHQIPIPEGNSFSWFQKNKVFHYAECTGFPLVVKPSNGSVSYHVTTNIQNKVQLALAVNHALRYGPKYILERYIPGHVFRGTVINNSYLACLQQIPAHVVGDGHASIRELIDKKNMSKKDERLYHDIVINETTHHLLKEHQYTLDSIPEKGEVVSLQKDPFLKLGGDLKDVTSAVHPDNKALFLELAELFSLKLVGIDFIAQDISVSWKEQECAVLELNSSPAIEMHHLPSIGTPQNPARALVAMMQELYS